MKKTICVSAMLVLATLANAQPYGQTTYPHPVSTTLGSGGATVNKPGFIMVGNPPSNTYNFDIDRVDVDGNFNNPSVHFSNEYTIFGDATQGCNGPLTQPVSTGVNVIETQPGTLPGCEYAIAGTFANGCFMSLLDNVGVPIPGRTFYFNSPPNAATPYNGALIVQDPASTDFFITGCFLEPSFQWTMYALRVDINGTVLWSNLHSVGATNTKIRPLGMILSPYALPGAPELAIVGIENDNSGNSDDGFFMNIDGNTGNINAFSTINGSGGSVETLLSISPAASPSSLGIPGYVISGYTNMYSPSSIQAWVAILDPTGTNLGWNDVVITTTAPGLGIAVRAIERLNTVSQYEYYAALGTNVTGMMAIKLDDTGMPAPGNSEFVYNKFCSSGSARDMSVINNSSSVNVGFQLYGNCGPDHYFVEACFNGVTGCRDFENLTKLNSILPGPPAVAVNVPVNTFGNLKNCPHFVLKVNPVNVKPNQCGPFKTIPPGGSNAKQVTVTGIAEQTGGGQLSVFPNPVTDKIFISYDKATAAPATLKLYNYLGQYVAELPVKANDKGMEASLQGLQLENGIYILKATIDGVLYNQKIIYSTAH